MFSDYFRSRKLTVQEHISILEGKVALSLGILFKYQHVFPHATLQQLYFASFILYLLVYRIIIWGAAYPTYLKNSVLQNKIIHIIISTNYYNNIDLAYCQLKIVDLAKYETVKFVYSCLHNKSPSF